MKPADYEKQIAAVDSATNVLSIFKCFPPVQWLHLEPKATCDLDNGTSQEQKFSVQLVSKYSRAIVQVLLL